MSILFPSSDIIVGAALLRVLAPSIFFASSLLVINSTFESCGRVQLPLFCMTVGGVIKIALSYILIAKTDLGIVGAPIGSLVSYAVSLLSALFIYGIVFDRPSPIFGQNTLSYPTAFVAVTLSRIAYDRIIFFLSPLLSLMAAIIISALIYFGFGAIMTLLVGKRRGKIAKYTNLFS